MAIKAVVWSSELKYFLNAVVKSSNALQNENKTFNQKRFEMNADSDKITSVIQS